MNDTVHFEKTLSSETLFEGRVITLTKDTALLENGKTATREVVHHHGGACILPYFVDGTICMVRQFRYDYDNWKATDADDLWAAGWYTNGYWSYWVKEGAAGSFGYSGWGASGRLLSDGSWDGWNFSVGFGSYDWKPFVAAPAGIPEDAKTLFKHDGIYYSLKSYSSKTVLVCAPAEMEGETLTSYSGDIVIPASFTDEETEYKVVGIADAAFAATEVTGITLPESVTEIGADAFSATPLATVKFAGEGSADQLRTIGDRAFCATAITEPIFPANVKNLGAGVFASTQIAEVVLPEGIVSVGEMCFADNAALTKVVIPQSVKTIASGAFAECPAIAEVRVENTVAPACSDDVFDAAVYAVATLTVPVGCVWRCRGLEKLYQNRRIRHGCQCGRSFRHGRNIVPCHGRRRD